MENIGCHGSNAGGGAKIHGGDVAPVPHSGEPGYAAVYMVRIAD